MNSLALVYVRPIANARMCPVQYELQLLIR
jgi:hypothetical protein